MELPKEVSEVKHEGIPMDLVLIVFGAPKVGKTTFASEFPDSVLLECEPGGAKYVRCKKMDINSLQEFREAYMLLKNDTSFKTVTIDSLDKVASWLEAEICKEMGLSNIMDAKKGERHGSQWGEYKERVLAFVLGLQKLGKNIVLLAHTKNAETDGNGSVINPRTINLYGQTASQVMAAVENIGYMFAREVEGGVVKRYISFKGGETVIGGSRHPALRDKVLELPLGGGYKEFEKQFLPPQPAQEKPKVETKTKTGGKK